MLPFLLVSDSRSAANPSHIEDDPVIATYSVYLTSPPPTSNTPRCMLIQYPDRNARHPYSPKTHQTPLALRLKPNTGLVELDIPIDTANYYNRTRGHTYASSLKASRILSAGGSHGLAGGFNTGPGGRVFRTDEEGDVDMRTIPRHGSGLGVSPDDDERELKVQTLGGKIAKAVDGDPIYMLGAFRGQELHLTHLDSLVQVRPQLHHLDAADEVTRGISRPAKKGEAAEKPASSETRAIEIKVKSSEEKNADRSRKKTNAELLTEIQSEPWQNYNWLDSSDPSTNSFLDSHMYHSTTSPGEPLTSALSPSAYLDAISAPRIDLLTSLSTSPSTSKSSHHLGLMSKVRGRERERRRRKKNDADRLKRAAIAAASKAKLDETARKTKEAVERGDMRKEDADEVVRLMSQEVESQAESEDDDDDDDDDEEEEEEEEDSETEEDEEDVVIDVEKSTSSTNNKPTSPIAKRGRGRPRKSSTTTTAAVHQQQLHKPDASADDDDNDDSLFFEE